MPVTWSDGLAFGDQPPLRIGEFLVIIAEVHSPGDPVLPEIRPTHHFPGLFLHDLERRRQDRQQDRNNGNDDQ
jgi:hypothetical protein